MSAMLPRHPRLISLEGGEGAGKSTAINAIVDWFAREGRELLVTREPGGTVLAERIRALLLEAGEGEEKPWPETELLLAFAARAQHLRERIEPALRRGAFVVSDRFTDSSYAYQGAGRGLDPGWIGELERRVVGFTPGLTLLLDLDVAVGRARASGRDARPDRIEREHDAFFQRVRAGFRQRAAEQADRFQLIDAGQSPAQVAAAVTAAVARFVSEATT